MSLPSYDCAICNNGIEETLQHLFFQCPLALACWNLLQVTQVDSYSFFGTIENIKSQLSSSIFMSLSILLCWTIWTARNDLIFSRNSTIFGAVQSYFQKRTLVAYASSQGKTQTSVRRMDKLLWLILVLFWIFFLSFFVS